MLIVRQKMNTYSTRFCSFRGLSFFPEDCDFIPIIWHCKIYLQSLVKNVCKLFWVITENVFLLFGGARSLCSLIDDSLSFVNKNFKRNINECFEIIGYSQYQYAESFCSSTPCTCVLRDFLRELVENKNSQFFLL